MLCHDQNGAHNIGTNLVLACLRGGARLRRPSPLLGPQPSKEQEEALDELQQRAGELVPAREEQEEEEEACDGSVPRAC